MDDDTNLGSSDLSDQPQVDNTKRRPPIGVTGAVGAVAGILAGLLGIGGGLVIVPMLRAPPLDYSSL